MMQPSVYMLASKPNGKLFLGVTSDLFKRVWEHQNQVVAGVNDHCSVDLLVWYELHQTMEAALEREKTVKAYNRPWKLLLIEGSNPHWVDLSCLPLKRDSGLRREHKVKTKWPT